MDDLGVPLFLETPTSEDVSKWTWSPLVVFSIAGDKHDVNQKKNI